MPTPSGPNACALASPSLGEKRTVDLALDVSVDLRLDGERLLGIGQVRVGGIAIRSAATAIRPDLSTPDAIHYQDFVLRGMAQSGGARPAHGGHRTPRRLRRNDG